MTRLLILPPREPRPLSLMEQARAEAAADAEALLRDASSLLAHCEEVTAAPDAYAVGVVNVARVLATSLRVQVGVLGSVLGRGRR